MLSRHGVLEGAILTTLWELESKGIDMCSVKDVFDNLKCDKRAYTTIKTVMDRLTTKKMLIKQKRGKKYYYKTTYSNSDIVVNSLNDLSRKYCCGNLEKLSEILNNMQVRKKSSGA